MSTSDYSPILTIVTELLELSAHLVPLGGFYGRPLPEDAAEYDRWKVPTRSWKDRAACNADALARAGAGHWFGLIPSSLGLVVLDVDDGDVDSLCKMLTAQLYGFERVRTRRGWHIYLRAGADWPTGNWQWELAGCSGDIRYDVGYVVVWDPAALLGIAELGDTGAADNALAAIMRKRSPAPLFDTAAPAATGVGKAIDPSRYPSGKRDDVLLRICPQIR